MSNTHTPTREAILTRLYFDLSCAEAKVVAINQAHVRALDPEWDCPACGILAYATLMSGRGGLRSCPACGGIVTARVPSSRS